MWNQSASGELIKGLIAWVVLIVLFGMCLAAYENFLTEARNKAQKWSDQSLGCTLGPKARFSTCGATLLLCCERCSLLGRRLAAHFIVRQRDEA